MTKTQYVRGPSEHWSLVEFLVEKRTRFLRYLLGLHTQQGSLWMNTVSLNATETSQYFRVSEDVIRQARHCSEMAARAAQREQREARRVQQEGVQASQAPTHVSAAPAALNSFIADPDGTSNDQAWDVSDILHSTAHLFGDSSSIFSPSTGEGTSLHRHNDGGTAGGHVARAETLTSADSVTFPRYHDAFDGSGAYDDVCVSRFNQTCTEVLWRVRSLGDEPVGDGAPHQTPGGIREGGISHISTVASRGGDGGAGGATVANHQPGTSGKTGDKAHSARSSVDAESGPGGRESVVVTEATDGSGKLQRWIRLPVKPVTGLPTAVSEEWNARMLPFWFGLAQSLSDLVLANLNGADFVELLYQLLLEADVVLSTGTAARAIANHTLKNYRHQRAAKGFTAGGCAGGSTTATGDAPSPYYPYVAGDTFAPLEDASAAAAVGSSTTTGRGASPMPSDGVPDGNPAAKSAAGSGSHGHGKLVLFVSDFTEYTTCTPSYDMVVTSLCSLLVIVYRKLCDYDALESEDCVKKVLSIDRRLKRVFIGVLSKELQKLGNAKTAQQAALLTDGFLGSLMSSAVGSVSHTVAPDAAGSSHRSTEVRLNIPGALPFNFMEELVRNSAAATSRRGGVLQDARDGRHGSPGVGQRGLVDGGGGVGGDSVPPGDGCMRSAMLDEDAVSDDDDDITEDPW